MTLRTKLSLLLAGLLVATIGVAGGGLYYETSKNTRREIHSRLQLLAESRAFALEDNLELLGLELARRAELVEIDEHGELLAQQPVAGPLTRSTLYNTAVLLIDANGTCKSAFPDREDYRVTNYGDRPWFAAARSNGSNPIYVATEEPVDGRTLKVIQPTVHKRQFIGLIVGLIALNQANLVTPILRDDLPADTDAVLTDGAGKVVYPTQRAHAVAGSDWGRAITLAASHAGTLEGTADGKAAIFAFAPIKAVPGFALVFKWPWSSVTGDLRAQGWVILGVLLAGVLLAGVFGLLLAAAIARPLEALADSARRIAADQPVTALPRAGSDEVGALVLAFEHMTHAIGERDERLRQAIGKTAAMVGHELKNSLNGLGMAVELIADDPQNRARVDRLKPQVLSEVRRLRDIVDSLLSISRSNELRIARSSNDLVGVIRRAIDVLEDVIADRSATVECRVPERLDVDCDGHKLQGVVMNLVKNAVEAGRHVKVSAHAGEHEIVVDVEDDGPGVTEETRRRLFEPFFTTKSSGTGLGLATSLRYVQAHGGQLEVDRSPTFGGARFRVRLPEAQTS